MLRMGIYHSRASQLPLQHGGGWQTEPAFCSPPNTKHSISEEWAPQKVAGSAHAGSCWRRQEGLHTVPQAGTTLPRCPTFSVLLLQHVPTSNMERAPCEEGDSGAVDDKNPAVGFELLSSPSQKATARGAECNLTSRARQGLVKQHLPMKHSPRTGCRVPPVLYLSTGSKKKSKAS